MHQDKPVTEMTPSEWLDYLRTNEQNYDDKISEICLDEFKGVLSDALGEISPDVENFLTREPTRSDFENIVAKILTEEASRLLQNNESTLVSDVYLGVYPTKDINGHADKTPKGDKYVALHNGLFTWLKLWADAITYQQECQQNKSPVDTHKLLCHAIYTARFWGKDERLFNIPSKVSKLIHPIRLHNKQSLYISNGLYSGAIWFILGHEYGHIIEKHHSYSSNDQLLNHETEFTADQWGLQFLIRYIKQVLYEDFPPKSIENQSLLAWSILGPFAAIGAIGTLNDGSSTTHPSPQDRMIRIQEDINIMTSAMHSLGFMVPVKELLRNGKKVFDELMELGSIMRSLGDEIDDNL